MSKREDEEKKRKKQKSLLEAEILALIQCSLKAVLNTTIDELLKDFK